MSFYNAYDFNLTSNYQALLACILNPDLTTEKALASVALTHIRSDSRGKNDIKCKVTVIDEVKNKKYEFTNLTDCCEFLNIKRTSITTYIKYRRKYKKRYRILAEGDYVSTRNKAREVNVIDTVNRECFEFESMSKAGRFLKTNNKVVAEHIEKQKLYKKRYKIEYKMGEEKR